MSNIWKIELDTLFIFNSLKICKNTEGVVYRGKFMSKMAGFQI
ncbi:MAG: hypothetical protein U5L45_08815 [Saprospiraceae bacterium]|nr:hypothetical protein [Saprospiraceae bacterium]